MHRSLAAFCVQVLTITTSYTPKATVTRDMTPIRLKGKAGMVRHLLVRAARSRSPMMSTPLCTLRTEYTDVSFMGKGTSELVQPPKCGQRAQHAPRLAHLNWG